ncbi:MAG: 5-formyltetrahydrofolate cyclo-ligase, partial [Geminicoccaceae bacterium]
GKGYYDRTLGHLRSQGRRPLAIGIAFAAQEVEEVPAGPADIRLDGVITESVLHRFGGPGAGA